MKFLCEKFGIRLGCTWVQRSENPKVAWNTGKDLTELHISADDEEPAFWLECIVCGKRKDDPSAEEIKEVS